MTEANNSTAGYSTSHLNLKRDAVERLLEWGFAPTMIATVLGVSTEWIDAIHADVSSRRTRAHNHSRA